MSKYDDLVKRLGRLCPDDFVRWLFPNLKVKKVSFEDREFELTYRRVDLLYKVNAEKLGEFYFHLEFQVILEDDFAMRLHEYVTRIHRQFGLPVKTVAVFLDSTQAIKDLLPVDRHEFAGELISEFHYTKIILPEEQWSEVMTKGIPALLPLIPLTKIQKGEEKEALSQAAKVIAKLPDKQLRKELAAILYLIGGYDYKEAIKEVIGEKLMLDLMKSATYQETIELGKKEGIKEGGNEKAKSIAKNMLAKGCDVVFIAEVTGLTADEIRQLKA